MNRLVRITGFLLIAAGVIVTLTWFIEPLREVWPWLLELPLPIRVGFILAGVGLILLVGSLIWERWEARDEDRALRDEEI
jgi:phosphoglycerol transferase MdoB-like AlkP superfamily enzyme